MNEKGVIYETPRGFPVRKLSHSQYSEYVDSPARFRWKRIYGMKEKYTWATTEFGHAIQASVQAHLAFNLDPAEFFEKEWRERSSKPNLKFSFTTDSAKLMTQGLGLMEAFLKRRAAGEFQMRKLQFPDMKAGTALVQEDPETGCSFQSIPDIIGEDDKGPFVADIKALDKSVKYDTPGLVVNDIQLRTQAALAGINRVVLWVFVRTPQHPPAPTVYEIIEAVTDAKLKDPIFMLEALRKTNGLTIEDAGKALNIGNPKELAKEMLAMRKKPIDERALDALDLVLSSLAERRAPVYGIQWLEAEMTPAWAAAAVQDELRVIPDIQAGRFPCRCSVRWPNDSIHDCPYRGLCLREATAHPTSEQLEAWEKITQDNLEGWSDNAAKDL